MMNNISTLFSIKDLENLSGVKAHTIRIWEKRYALLEPNRTDSNIRFYDEENLKKLLNVTLLYNKGFKISRIASFTSEQLQSKVREFLAKGDDLDHFVSSLKLSMLNYDQPLFEQSYHRMLEGRSFNEVYVDIFIPFLQDLGLQWQSDTITPAHEHFITHLIKQKLLLNIDRVQQLPARFTDQTYVLFLPLNEIHDFGLLYVHYALLLRGFHSVFLGQSVPVENLVSLQQKFNSITFISYFTVEPEAEKCMDYVMRFNQLILNNRPDALWLLGRRTHELILPDDLVSVKIFAGIDMLLHEFNQ